ncbi:hypothetical protein B296_00002975 [Ensete ventricosum]|uniref:Uncharacterized protein n=1 Tax=Ensete ventricosum TaxID=4639 RepID=A0A427ANU7_ENSVE|nr:hypothetical protein B296_00002975 [Ensete ventricosum]
MELQPDYRPRLNLGIGPGSYVRRFAEGIRKLVGNTPGDHRKKTIGLAARMSKTAGLCGRFGLHPKKIGTGRWCASRRRIRG